MAPKHPCEQDQMNEQLFYYQKGKAVSFFLPNDIQFNIQYNNFAREERDDLKNEVLYQMDVLIQNAIENTSWHEKQKKKMQ